MKHIKAAPFGNRMLQTGSVPAGQLLANPANFRVHPVEQQTVLATMLERIGFIQSVIVNKRSDPSWERDRGIETVIDGHLRVSLALSRGEETEVPVVWVDLTREEEAAALATFDPIGAMAGTDREKLALLVAELPDDIRDLTDVLRVEAKSVRELVAFQAERASLKQYVVVVECKNRQAQRRLLDRLIGEGLTCRAMVE